MPRAIVTGLEESEGSDSLRSQIEHYCRLSKQYAPGADVEIMAEAEDVLLQEDSLEKVKELLHILSKYGWDATLDFEGKSYYRHKGWVRATN